MNTLARYIANKAREERRAEERRIEEHHTEERMRWWWLGQRDPIARSSAWLVVVTGLLVVVTALLVGVGVWNALVLQYTDETLKATMEHGQRAYVLYSSNKITFLEDNNFRVSMALKNRGQTPAYGVRIWWTAKVYAETPWIVDVHNDFRRQPVFPEHFDLDPTNEWPIENDFPISVDEMLAVDAGRKFVFVWGIFRFKDAFQRCQYAAMLVRNGRRAQNDSWSFRAIAIENSPEAACDKDGRAVYPDETASADLKSLKP